MYTARKTELGKLRQYEHELTAMYAEALLRKRLDDAKAIYARRHNLRRAILQHQEWNVRDDAGTIDTFPRELTRQEEVAEDLARVA